MRRPLVLLALPLALLMDSSAGGLSFARAQGVDAGAVAGELPKSTTTAPQGKSKTLRGFRMEGSPKVENLFGDTALLTHLVDDYLTLYEAMQRTRDRFSRAVQTVLTTIAGQPPRPAGDPARCPVGAIALEYARAHHLGQDFERSSVELDRLHDNVRELDMLGETIGLTPDYRWKVTRVLRGQRQVTADWAELRNFFRDHVGREISYLGCDPAELLREGQSALAKQVGSKAGAVAEEAPPSLPLRPSTEPKNKGKADLPPPVAKIATFNVDNSLCKSTLRVYLDSLLVGSVAGGAKGAFSTLSGPHDLCLLDAAGSAQCGATGTVRHTYIHPGWAIAMRCPK